MSFDVESTGYEKTAISDLQGTNLLVLGSTNDKSH